MRKFLFFQLILRQNWTASLNLQIITLIPDMTSSIVVSHWQKKIKAEKEKKTLIMNRGLNSFKSLFYDFFVQNMWTWVTSNVDLIYSQFVFKASLLKDSKIK